MTTDERLGPLTLLVGTWKGSGHGVYPTIDSFDYTEELTVSDPGSKPYLFCVQRTWAADGRPLHAEAGYLRWTGTAPEWVVAQPSGIAEAHHGTVLVGDGRVELAFDSSSVASTPAAKQVDRVSRRLWVEDDVLTYEVDMQAVGQPHQLHLRATLRRDPSSALSADPSNPKKGGGRC